MSEAMLQALGDSRFCVRRFTLAAACTLALVAPLVQVARSIARPEVATALRPALSLANPNLVILKSRRIVHLFDGERLIHSYPCDLGSSPIGDKRIVGDRKTPVGVFRVASKNDQSPYRRFLGLDYPHRAAVEAGLAAGLISEGAAHSLLRALGASRCPDWSTALGGGIGLHGHRQGRDWTGGCIAVSDRAIDELFGILRIGDRVEILP